MFNQYVAQDQDRRILSDRDALDNHYNLEATLNTQGVIDGIKGIDPHPDLWRDSAAYKYGFLEGVEKQYDIKYNNVKRQQYPENEPF